ncbi:MAG: CoA pyrophosphatase [Deltaproteobacteria bacterium]|nr:CoA pyrophosphatase [Deltaproteobacteria bacterium]
MADRVVVPEGLLARVARSLAERGEPAGATSRGETWLHGEPGEARPTPSRRAAVAALLHERDGDTGVLLMKRVERAGDPWSGHISLPGGGFHTEDETLLTTAIRETHEELGIDLGGARLLGGLPPLHPRASGPGGIEVTPFVFAADAPPDVVCGPEALAAFWLPLGRARSGALDATYHYPSSPMTFPSWRHEGHVIWGLTYRILLDLLALA